VRLPKALLALVVPFALGACEYSSSSQRQQPQQPQQQAQQQPWGPYGQQPTPPPQQQPPYGQQPYPQQPQQQPTTPPAAQMPAQRPLLAPLVGVQAWQQELRMILTELLNALPANNQALVRGIPLVFDPTVEVNAFAGCDEQGQPFLAATTGIFEAVDAVAQTKATDELFGTQTYDAYSSQVLPALTKSDKARAALPAGIIPANLGPDARRWSRAHEIFDEVLAFTFGHELAHHYLGHTGCAKGQPMGAGPDPSRLGRLVMVVPAFNQVGEAAADSAGTINALDAGRARRPQYQWNEAGGVTLLNFFARIERAGGGGGLGALLNPVAILRTHPNPLLRIPLVQTTARTWHFQHPG
jgi:hypothetical protein